MDFVGTALLGVQGLLALAMIGAGGAKVAGIESLVEDFDRFGYPQWFRVVTGLTELIAGVALAAAFFVSPLLALTGGVLVAGTMGGAILTHVRLQDPIPDITPPALLLGFALLVLWNYQGAVL